LRRNSELTAAIEVRELSKRFRIYHHRRQTLKESLLRGNRTRYEEFWALRDVSLEVGLGTTLGIVGENGSGKSTLLKCLAGILRPDRGTARVQGRLAALLELGAGFHPEYSGLENIYINGALMGLSRREVRGLLDDIVAFSGLERFIDNPIKTYSSGMYARLGFAIAVHLRPDVLLIDEILAVGDEEFQRHCYERLAQLRAAGKTMVLVSHALEAVREHSDHCIWLEAGVIRSTGAADGVITDYLREVNRRESERMRAEATAVHVLVPSGRGGVGVTGVTFLAASREAQVLETGAPFEIAVEYHAPRPLHGVRFTLEFIREDGLMVFSTCTDDDIMRRTHLPPQGTMRFKMSSLPLLDSLYRLSVILTDIATEEPYTILEKAFPFRVRSSKRREKGVALLDYEWELPVRSPRSRVSA